VLVITTTIAFLAVAALLGLFLAHRLYLHLAEAFETAKEGTSTFGIVRNAFKTWWDETRSRVGLGPYTYRVSAFEDYKAFSTTTGSPQSASARAELKPPRIVYEEITDYSKHHPQPTPSFQGPKTVKVEREEPDSGLDLFSPKSQPDTVVVKREIDDSEWTSESEGGAKK